MRTIRLLAATAVVGATVATLAVPASAAGPQLAGFGPNHLLVGSGPVSLSLNDVGVDAGATLVDPSGDIDLTDVVQNGGIQTTTATVGPDASVGRHDVVVTNPDSSTSQCSGCLYVGHLPGAPGLATLTPGDGQVDLTWHPSTSDEPTSLDYLIQVRTIDDQAISDSGTSAPFFTASGLTNGSEYRIEVTPRDAFGYGEPLHVTARPGRTPEQPVLSSAPAPDMVHIDAAVVDYGYASTFTFRLVPRVGGGQPIVVETSQPAMEYPSYDRSGFTVTATATNYFGDSVAAEPIIARPQTVPGPPRHVWWARSGQRYTVHWAQPLDDGGLPITRYRIDLGVHHVYFAPPTARSLTLPLLPAGRIFNVSVYARNAIGRTEIPAYNPLLGTDIGIVTGLDGRGRARWRWTTSAAWHGLGGSLVAPPSAARAVGRRWFVGVSSAGRLVGRTASTSWRVLSRTTCLQAYAGPDGQGGLEILCLNKDRHVIDGVLSAGQLRAGTSTIGDRDWAGFGDDRTILDLGAGIAEEVGVATLAARVAPYNADGDNLLVRHLYVDDGWRRVRHLHCDAVPAITAYGDGYMAACSTGAHHVALVGSSDGRLRVHRVATPVAIRSGVGAVTFKDGFSQLSVVGRGGRLWLLDVGQGRWWSQGRATQAPVRISRWNS